MTELFVIISVHQLICLNWSQDMEKFKTHFTQVGDGYWEMDLQTAIEAQGFIHMLKAKLVFPSKPNLYSYFSRSYWYSFLLKEPTYNDGFGFEAA